METKVVPVDPPFWFRQRQCKAEPAGPENLLKLTGPNLGEAFILIRRADNERWQSALRLKADGPDVAATEPEISGPKEAWEAAFELYRQHVIV